jgi:hypothetical protein
VLPLTLRVRDASDREASDETDVTVRNVAPVVSPIGSDGRKRTIDVAAAFVDRGALDTHEATWDWGDGSTTKGRVLEHRGLGATVAEHTYARKGTYTVKVTVVDDDGGRNISTAQVKVN